MTNDDAVSENLPLKDARSCTAVLVVNLGTPKAPKPPQIRHFLREFLSDRRVVEMSPLLWKPILEGIVLPFRPRVIQEQYESIWTEHGSPLMHWTLCQVERLSERLGDSVTILPAMRYGEPSIQSQLDIVQKQGIERVIVLPAYPQYSASTVGSIFDECARWILKNRNQLDMQLVRAYYDVPAYIEALAVAIESHWEKVGRPDFEAGDQLIASYHSIPMAMHNAGDPYRAECEATSARLRERLGLSDTQLVDTYQSVFGKAEWIGPATIDTMKRLPKAGTKRVDVICPGFMADCLETIEEINSLNRTTFLEAGGREFHYIPWGNDSDGVIEVFEEQIRQRL